MIIMDVVMNNITGQECAQQITAYNKRFDDWVPIIFLSAMTSKHTIIDAINSGGDDYLTKPFNIELLGAKIKVMQRIANMRAKLMKLNEKLKTTSLTDSLTNIANREHFEQMLASLVKQSTESSLSFAVLFIDLDRFKTINDTLGHDIGDELLIQASQRIADQINPSDFLARLGGDEFAVLLHNIDTPSYAGDKAQQIITAVSQNYTLKGHNISITTSIGIACFPNAGKSREQLLKHADIAMYRAKTIGRNEYQFFSDELNHAYSKRLQLEQALSSAVHHDEFTLAFQPKYQLKPQCLTGFEILIRWHNSKLGTISPDVFIPIAEETGLIKPIGAWVIQHACKALSALQPKFKKKLHFAINISPIQLMESSVLDLLKKTIQHYDLQCEQIELEVTETAIMANTDAIEHALYDLHNMGIHIDIDDFGTGFSSLSHIKRLPVDGLKIDKEFVADIPCNDNDAAIVKSIIQFAKSLGLNVTAEGIESQAQVDYLIDNGCNQGQGFYLSKPLDFEQTLQLITKLQCD